MAGRAPGGSKSEDENVSGSALWSQKDTSQGPFLTLPGRMAVNTAPPDARCDLGAKPPRQQEFHARHAAWINPGLRCQTDDPYPTCRQGQPELSRSQLAFVLLPLNPGLHRGLPCSPGEGRFPALPLPPSRPCAGLPLTCSWGRR